MTKNYQTKRPRAATLEPEIVVPEAVSIAMGELAQRCIATGDDTPPLSPPEPASTPTGWPLPRAQSDKPTTSKARGLNTGAPPPHS